MNIHPSYGSNTLGTQKGIGICGKSGLRFGTSVVKSRESLLQPFAKELYREKILLGLCGVSAPVGHVSAGAYAAAY